MVNTFFCLHFIVSGDCISIDQNKKTETIIKQVFGPAWKKQHPSSSYSLPMKTGTTYSESLAREIEFGLKHRSILMSCMHLALWTRLDILPACVVLAQYQSHPAVICDSFILLLSSKHVLLQNIASRGTKLILEVLRSCCTNRNDGECGE
jgi:hypothetical protein